MLLLSSRCMISVQSYSSQVNISPVRPINLFRSFPRTHLWRQRRLDITTVSVRTNGPPTQALIPRPCRSGNIFLLSKNIDLSWCRVRQLIIAPTPSETQPSRRIHAIIRSEHSRTVIITIQIGRHERVPKRAFVRVIGQRARFCIQIRNRMIMRADGGVVCMRPVRDVHHRTHTVGPFLCSGVCEGLAAAMLRVVYGRWRTADEPNHRVLPVADVISKLERGRAQHPIPLVVRVEVEVKGVDDVVGLGHCDNGTGDGRWSAAVRLRASAAEPRWQGLDAFIRSQIDVRPRIGKGIQAVEVGQRQCRRRCDGRARGIFWVRVGNLRSNVAGKVDLRGAEIRNRC